MTMNYQRRNAVHRAGEFLFDIVRKEIEVSEEVWQEARSILKHFPSEYDLERAAEQAPEVFGDREYYRLETSEWETAE
jgi:hypothetical protein